MLSAMPPAGRSSFAVPEGVIHRMVRQFGKPWIPTRLIADKSRAHSVQC
jgi:hypothetical protein